MRMSIREQLPLWRAHSVDESLGSGPKTVTSRAIQNGRPVRRGRRRRRWLEGIDLPLWERKGGRKSRAPLSRTRHTVSKKRRSYPTLTKNLLLSLLN